MRKFSITQYVEQIFHEEVAPYEWVWVRSGNGDPDFEYRTPYAQPWANRSDLQCKPGAKYNVTVQLVDAQNAAIGIKASGDVEIPGVKIGIPSVIVFD